VATIKVLKDAIYLCGQSGITPFIWGHRGMGKSSIVKQLAAERNMGFVDERCSQMEASDLRGLPDRVDGRTAYLPPQSMPVGDLTNEQVLLEILRPFEGRLEGKTPQEQHTKLLELVASDIHTQRIYERQLKRLQPHFERGILFLDELNRGQDDVLQAAFQLVLDREVGQYRLPPGWFPVAAGNFMEGYQVNGFTDPAFLDRFCHLTFSGGESTLEDWIMYMTTAHGGDAAAIIEYASQNVVHLDGKTEGDLGFTVQPSRRSWDAVARVEKEYSRGGYSPEARFAVLAGLVGPEAALAFTRYSCPVKPRDILERGVQAMASDLAKLNRNQLTGLMWGIVSFAKPRIDEHKVQDVCADFAEWICTKSPDKDFTVAFCRTMVSAGSSSEMEKAKAAVISNPKLAQMIGKFNQKTGGKRAFIDVLNARPKLQQLIANTAWGT